MYVADTSQDLLGEDTAGLRQHPVVCVFLGATPSSTTLLGHILLSYLLRKHKLILYHSIEQFSTTDVFSDGAHFTLGVVIGFKQLKQLVALQQVHDLHFSLYVPSVIQTCSAVQFS